MRFLIRKFLNYREVFSIAMYFCGLPIIYFFRDGLKLAPNSAAFTIAGSLGPLGLTLLFKNFKKIYAPHPVGYFICLWFVIITFLYLIFRDPYSNVSGTYELFSYSFILFIFFTFTTISSEALNRNFLPIALSICAIGALLLLYSVYKDPFYVIGQRAAIKYRTEEEGNTGNPHIFSKVAFFGFILSTILLKNLSKFRVNILIPIGLLLIFVVVLFLTQTMITFLTTAIFLFLFFIFNFNLRSIYRSVLALLLKWYVLAILIFGVYKVSNYLKDNEDALKPATTYISNRIEKVAATVFGGAASKEKKEKKVDESAVMRVQLVTEVFIKMEENFEEGKIRYILFGNGYKSLYVDVPIFEALDSFGFFMFLFYLLIYSYLSMMCLKEMKNPRSIATEFIAYGFIYFMIQNLTGGLLMDFNRWGYYALVARFLVPIGYKVSENFKESKVSTLSNLN